MYFVDEVLKSRQAEAGSSLGDFEGVTYHSVAYLNTRNTRQNQTFLCV